MSVAVVASDSPEGREALVHAVAESEVRGQVLIALAVVDADSVTDEDRQATRLANQQVLANRGLADAQFSLLLEPDGGDPAAAIVQMVADVGASLLVMGARRRSAVGKHSIGTTAQRVLLDSPVPVLVVTAQDNETSR